MITSMGNPNKMGRKPAPQSLEQKYHMKSPGERTRQLAVRGHHLTVLLHNQNRNICLAVLTSFVSQTLTRHTLHITKVETSIRTGTYQVLSPTRLKKQSKRRHFSSDAEVIAAAEAWLDGQTSDFFFLSCLQKLRVWSL